VSTLPKTYQTQDENFILDLM